MVPALSVHEDADDLFGLDLGQPIPGAAADLAAQLIKIIGTAVGIDIEAIQQLIDSKIPARRPLLRLLLQAELGLEIRRPGNRGEDRQHGIELGIGQIERGFVMAQGALVQLVALGIAGLWLQTLRPENLPDQAPLR